MAAGAFSCLTDVGPQHTFVFHTVANISGQINVGTATVVSHHPVFRESCGHLFSYFKTSRAYGRTYNRPDTPWISIQSSHCIHSVFDDTSYGASPPGMGGGDHSVFRVIHDHRHAVCGIDAYYYSRHVCYKSVVVVNIDSGDILPGDYCHIDRVCLTGHKKFVVSYAAPFGETAAALHEMCLPVARIMAQRESGIIIFPARLISTPCGGSQYAVFVGKCRYRNIPVLRITVLHAAKIALFWRRWPFGRLHITLKLANFAQKGYDGKGVFKQKDLYSMKTRDELIDDLLTLAFAEDVGDGDATTLSTIPAEEKGRQKLIVKETGILAGVDIARKVFEKFDPSLKMTVYINDGARVKPGDVAFEVEGTVRSLLQTERVMLNIMQRMSGVATMTDRYQQKLEGLKTKVLDTRKTTPGMRMLEKEAVKIGGGCNHRIGLFDMILIKDNHVDFAGGIPQAVSAAKKWCADNGKNLQIELEVRNTAEIDQALEAGVDRIMLDNFTPERTREAVEHIRAYVADADALAADPHKHSGKDVEIESSGGITIETLRDYGECGVDFISVGALTHSVKGLDMSFKAC